MIGSFLIDIPSASSCFAEGNRAAAIGELGFHRSFGLSAPKSSLRWDYLPTQTGTLVMLSILHVSNGKPWNLEDFAKSAKLDERIGRKVSTPRSCCLKCTSGQVTAAWLRAAVAPALRHPGSVTSLATSLLLQRLLRPVSRACPPVAPSPRTCWTQH